MTDITLPRPSSKVIDINHIRTKEEIEQGRENLKKFYERRNKIIKMQNKLRYGNSR